MLENQDFLLTEKQLDHINNYFSDRSIQYAQAGEDAPGSAKVVFEWVPGLGRSVIAFFDGEINGCEIENLFD